MSIASFLCHRSSLGTGQYSTSVSGSFKFLPGSFTKRIEGWGWKTSQSAACSQSSHCHLYLGRFKAAHQPQPEYNCIQDKDLFFDANCKSFLDPFQISFVGSWPWKLTLHSQVLYAGFSGPDALIFSSISFSVSNPQQIYMFIYIYLCYIFDHPYYLCVYIFLKCHYYNHVMYSNNLLYVIMTLSEGCHLSMLALVQGSAIKILLFYLLQLHTIINLPVSFLGTSPNS